MFEKAGKTRRQRKQLLTRMDDPELAAAIAASLLDADPAAGDAPDAGSAATGDSGAGGGFAVAMATDDVKGAAGAREALMQLKGALSLTAAGGDSAALLELVEQMDELHATK